MRSAVIVLKPLLTVLTRRTWLGRENVPLSGGVVLVANHISMADPLVLAHFVYDLPREPRFLGKVSVFEAPVLGRVLRGAGQIPVQRDSVDAVKALDAAVEAVSRGECVIIYPEGTCTEDPDLWPMKGRTGVARLALLTGAPVVPVAQWGAQRLHDPRTRTVRLRPRTPVAVRAGAPVDLGPWTGRPVTAELLGDLTEHLMLTLRDLVADLRGEPPPQGPLLAPSPRTVAGTASSAPGAPPAPAGPPGPAVP